LIELSGLKFGSKPGDPELFESMELLGSFPSGGINLISVSPSCQPIRDCKHYRSMQADAIFKTIG